MAQATIEVFKNSLDVIEKLYSKKFEKFYSDIDPNLAMDDETCKVLQTLQTAVDDFIAIWNGKDSAVEKMLIQLFKCIEQVHKSLDIEKDSEFSQSTFEWLFAFCRNNEINSKNLAFVNKILFDLNLRYRAENFFGTVAANFCSLYDYFVEKDQPLQFIMKSITKANRDVCFNQMVEILERQIDDVEYFLKKCRSVYDKVRNLLKM